MREKRDKGLLLATYPTKSYTSEGPFSRITFAQKARKAVNPCLNPSLFAHRVRRPNSGTGIKLKDFLDLRRISRLTSKSKRRFWKPVESRGTNLARKRLQKVPDISLPSRICPPLRLRAAQEDAQSEADLRVHEKSTKNRQTHEVSTMPQCFFDDAPTT